MQIDSYVAQLAGKPKTAIFAVEPPLVVIERDGAGAYAFPVWDLPGVPEPTADQIKAALAQLEPPARRTVFASRELMQVLFTAAEREVIFQAAQKPEGWQVFQFITYTAATPQIDITDAEFVADIGAVEAAGLLTAARAAQVLAGTTAPAN